MMGLNSKTINTISTFVLVLKSFDENVIIYTKNLQTDNYTDKSKKYTFE